MKWFLNSLAKEKIIHAIINGESKRIEIEMNEDAAH